MHDEIAIDETIPLPIPPTGWFDYGYAILCNGSLALVRADRDIHALWSEKVRGGDIHASDFSNWHVRLSVFDGNIESDAIEVPAGNWPKVDRLADGRWLVASTRATLNEKNGRLLWRFNSEALTGPPIDDCYALALDGSTLWCCCYSDFPIVRVNDGAIEHWRNTVAGARALAVNGNYVLLAGGYGDEANRVALLRLDGNLAKPVHKWRLPTPVPETARLVQGRGTTLHIVGQGCWTQISLATVLASKGLFFVEPVPSPLHPSGNSS